MRQKTIFKTQPSSFRPAKRVVPQDGSVKLFRYQERAISRLRHEQFMILKAPTGSGKSYMIEYIGLEKLTRNARLKLIVAVPQISVANNFTASHQFFIGGRRVAWAVGHDLTRHADKVQRLIDFLRSRPSLRSDLSGRKLVVTHATLAAAYNQLAESDELHLFRNVCVFVDEAHHVKNAQVSGTDAIVSNSLGKLVKHLVAVKSFVGLVTATWVRGDQLHILDESIAGKFKTACVSYEEVGCEQAIPPIHFDIICGDVYKAVKKLLRVNVPTILWLAKVNSHHAEKCKYATVEKLKRVIPQGRVVLDLVKGGQPELLAKVISGEVKVDVIIAQERCKEGFNWPVASRGIIIGERHSVTEVMQTIGRFMRPCEDKTSSIYQILPTPLNKKAFKDHKNRCLTMVFAGMAMAEFFAPIRLTMGDGRGSRGRVRRLSDLLDGNQIAELVTAFAIAVQERTWEQSLAARDRVLKEQGIASKDREWVWRALWTRLALTARYARGKGIATFNILKNERLWGGLLNLGTGLLGPMEMTALARIITGSFMTYAQVIALTERLSKAHDQGKLHLFERGGKLHCGVSA